MRAAMTYVPADELPTLDDAPAVEPEREPAAHDDSDEAHEAAPVEPGDVVET